MANALRPSSPTSLIAAPSAAVIAAPSNEQHYSPLQLSSTSEQGRALHESISQLSLSSSSGSTDDDREGAFGNLGRSSSSSSFSSHSSLDRPTLTLTPAIPKVNIIQEEDPPHQKTTSGLHRSTHHLRSQSSVGPHNSLPMTRTRSLPLERSSAFFSPSYSMSSSSRPRSPLRQQQPPPSLSARYSPRHSFEDDYRPSFGDFESIAEDSELDFSQRQDIPTPPTPAAALHSSISRSNSARRRPASPLVNQVDFRSGNEQMPTSPSVRFNEPFPTHGPGAFNVSSTSSTPTSFRSRSPSIASLDTIPDTPEDVEAEAEREAYDLAQLRAAADADSDSDNDRRGGRSGSSFGREKRKRWSVCGAERRGDFEMETIWED